MRIFKSSITAMARQGRASLQVPDVAIGKPIPETEEYPDDWFIVLKDNRPAIGRESGFLHLTRKGFEANKHQLQQALVGNPRGTTWEVFESIIMRDFAQVEKNSQKYINDLQKKIVDIQKALGKL